MNHRSDVIFPRHWPRVALDFSYGGEYVDSGPLTGVQFQSEA